MFRSAQIGLVVAAVALVATACDGGDSSPPSTTTILEATTTIPEALLAEISDNAIRDISYSQGHAKQSLDVYLPATGDGPFPTILAIHGGGFTGLSKNIYHAIGPFYAANGYAFVATDYRLVPGHTYPAQVEDSFCALAWLHDNAAEYRFDPSQVVVMGGSAGGYLASMVGTVGDPAIYLQDCPNQYPSTDAVHAAVIFYGLYDFTNPDDLRPTDLKQLAAFWGAEHQDIPAEQLEEMSPMAQIDGSEPPFIILHGTLDPSVPSAWSERFAGALEQASVDVELVLMPNVGHGFELNRITSKEMTLALHEIGDFLDRTLDP